MSNVFCTVGAETINDRDSLLDACYEGSLDDVLRLLNKGADVNCLSEVGNTPLCVTCFDGHLPIVKVLLENGANVNIGNEDGVTPLYMAASQGRFEIVKELLKVKGINVNASDDHGQTPLFCASSKGLQDIVGELLKSDGIKVNSVTYKGESALDIASKEEVKKALIQKSAIEVTPIIKRFNLFIAGVNKGDYEKLDSVVSENNKPLKNEIRLLVKDGFSYRFNPSPLFDNIEFIDSNKVKITGAVKANGRSSGSVGSVGWEIDEITNYFVFEKSNNEWFIIDTDFTQKLSSRNFWFIFIAAFGCIGFWIWMLVDCFSRKFDTRGRWFIFLLMFNLIAAILYFFIIKLRNVHT